MSGHIMTHGGGQRDRGKARSGRGRQAVDEDLLEPEIDRLGAPESEQAVLGAMLLSDDAVIDAVELLRAEDFYRPAHGAVFNAITALFDQGAAHDPVAVEQELERRGEAHRLQPHAADFLHTLMSRSGQVAYHAEVVAEKAVVRRLVEAGTRITQLGHAAAMGAELGEVVQRSQSVLDEVVTGKQSGASGYTTIAEMRAEAVSWLDDLQAGRIPPGISTGFRDLDELIGGFKGGQMIVVAARPGLGKSTLGVDFCRAASIKNHLSSVFFSLEMSRQELWLRILSAEAKIRHQRLTKPGELQPVDYDTLAPALERMSAASIAIDDSPKTTPTQMRARAKQLQARFGLDLVVVDYLQLMSTGTRAESRQVEVSEISRNIKLLAKELDVPVVAISQLNRGPEQRQDKKPMIGDLRESGSLEQDADMVILINRPDAYDRDDPRAGEADLVVAKNRSGPTGTVTVAHQLHYSRFVDLAATR